MDLVRSVVLISRVRQQLCLMHRTLSVPCLGRSSSPTDQRAVVIGSPAPRVVAITRSLIPFSKYSVMVLPPSSDRRTVFFFLLVFGHRIALFGFRYVALYRSPTYFDGLIGTTTPMTSTTRPDWHGWRQFFP